jgi:hypothetical protein
MLDPKVSAKVFRAKSRRRRELAKLSFEKKLKIMVRLQEIAREIRKDPRLRVWKIF